MSINLNQCFNFKTWWLFCCCLGQLVHCWVPQHNLKLCDDYSRLVWIHTVLQKGPWVEVNISWRTFTSIVLLRTQYSWISPTTPILLARWYDHYHDHYDYHHPRVPEQTCHAICLEIRKLKYFGYKLYLLWIWKVLCSWHDTRTLSDLIQCAEMRLAVLCCMYVSPSDGRLITYLNSR